MKFNPSNVCRRNEKDHSVGIFISKKIHFYKAVQNFLILFPCESAYKYSLLCIHCMPYIYTFIYQIKQSALLSYIFFFFFNKHNNAEVM